MQDLNDMLLFAEVVERGGFAAAGRALGLPKSRLSRRVAGLEAQLGVRLLQRTTRKLSLTDVGEAFVAFKWAEALAPLVTLTVLSFERPGRRPLGRFCSLWLIFAGIIRTL